MAGDLLDVEVPGVVLVMSEADPVVVCYHFLVQTEDGLVSGLKSLTTSLDEEAAFIEISYD